MNNIIRKVFDRFLGINFTVGFSLFLWLLLGLIITTPEINQKNMVFLLISCIVPWIINFIFSYTSKLYMKGLLHGVVWFVIEMILFNLMYGVALEAFVLLRVAVVYSVLYSGVLYLFYKLSAKLNIPVRHTAEFCGKLITTFKK